jgi:hypothetical protein
MSWREQAACRGMDPAEAIRIFFPARGESNAEARSYCDRCPVRQECLADALAYSLQNDLGVRGGKSERQRRRIRAAQTAACGLPDRQCQHCGETFTPHHRVQRYCTNVCASRSSQAAYRQRRQAS